MLTPHLMAAFFFNLLFRLLTVAPLRWLHALGGALGRLTYAASPTYAERTRENLTQSGLAKDPAQYAVLLKQTIAEAGKSILELPWVWGRPLDEICGQVQSCQGWEHVTAALERGKGLILLTPHWGCFEMVGLYMGKHVAITNLYRVPKQPWLETIMCQGRGRGHVHLAKADVSGVRLLYKALKRGEVIGLLPDQVPGNGEGEWVNFFGRPAYTMTLVGRLAQSSGASLVIAYAERLPGGRGYAMRIDPVILDLTRSVPQQINAELERVIALSPAQYLWSYNRYKAPPGVEAPIQATKEP
jgi:KDO2-lipid IV(A) lauroyltransferase